MAERIVFARSLYAPEAVRAAAQAYADLCTIELSVLTDSIEVTFSDPDESVADVLVDEFCNHALHETILGQRG
ncbi:MAG: hypothetical protein JRI68_32250 [Deltaproteobacteria bacterium]|nr:hypothetical protein [Deltaproteobacteria bacterium]